MADFTQHYLSFFLKQALLLQTFLLEFLLLHPIKFYFFIYNFLLQLIYSVVHPMYSKVIHLLNHYTFFSMCNVYNYFTLLFLHYIYLVFKIFIHYFKIYIHSKNIFSSWYIQGHCIQFPMTYSRTLLSIHSKCNSFYILTLSSLSIPVPPFFPLATTSLFFMSMSLFLFWKQDYFCHILDSTYK